MDSGTVFLIIFAAIMLFCCGGMMRGRKSPPRGKEREKETNK